MTSQTTFKSQNGISKLCVIGLITLSIISGTSANSYFLNDGYNTYLMSLTTDYHVYFETNQGFQEYLRYWNDFVGFMNKYDRAYSSRSELWYRYHNFVTNMERIEEVNSGNYSYRLGITPFVDHSFAEFSSKYLGYRTPSTETLRTETLRSPPVHTYTQQDLEHLPSAVDWRAEGWVTNIKNQEQCGSCWAFSTVASMEGQHANVTGNLTSLSEQNLVDCASQCYGCNGGWMYFAMEYVVQNGGIDTEASYPYTGMDGTCSYNASDSGASFSSYVNITKGDGAGLLHAAGTVGPISVAIDAENDMMMYKSGIFTSTECNTESLDHGVAVVGYGESHTGVPFYIIKNSWGTDWGMDGYIYWNRTDPNMCGIAEAASYPVV